MAQPNLPYGKPWANPRDSEPSYVGHWNVEWNPIQSVSTLVGADWNHGMDYDFPFSWEWKIIPTDFHSSIFQTHQLEVCLFVVFNPRSYLEIKALNTAA